MTTQHEIETLAVDKDLLIDAPIEVVFESVLEEMGPAMTDDNGALMRLKIEPFPGGRWFRDLGDGAGHLWGHVQVIKPPRLLEICGPMFMSYPAVNHVQYRLAAEGDGTRLKFAHRAIGRFDPVHKKGVSEGWQEVIDAIEKNVQKRMSR